jgi:mannose-6-phosphate isomerase-like protein (cupin superfamily)
MYAPIKTISSQTVINLEEKLAKFTEQWSPKIIAQMNDYHFKIVKLQGEFVWHSHADTDETFIVLEGELGIDFRDGPVTLKKGEMIVIPKGVEHKPFAKEECQVMLVEPAGTPNTGDEGGDRTVEPQWI